jgi:hypothetical protein
LFHAALALLLVTGFYPLARAWRAARGTTLRHAVAWTAAAWLAWVGAAGAGADAGLERYLALCATGSAGVAVLGARRPIAVAWNFVVASLLLVLLWSVAEGLGELRPNVFVTTLLAAALAAGMVNYLPTRLAAAVLPAGAACAVEMAIVLKVKGIDPGWSAYALALLAVAPWLGLAAARRRTLTGDEIDREWLDFRDRFGAVWALPARDQFNRASANAGWGVVLGWGGARPAGDPAAARPAEALVGLRALLKRFAARDESSDQ